MSINPSDILHVLFLLVISSIPFIVLGGVTTGIVARARCSPVGLRCLTFICYFSAFILVLASSTPNALKGNPLGITLVMLLALPSILKRTK